MIRTTTSDYGLPLFDCNEQPVKVRVGMNLIKLAIEGNRYKPEYIRLLEGAKKHYKKELVQYGYKAGKISLKEQTVAFVKAE